MGQSHLVLGYLQPDVILPTISFFLGIVGTALVLGKRLLLIPWVLFDRISSLWRRSPNSVAPPNTRTEMS